MTLVAAKGLGLADILLIKEDYASDKDEILVSALETLACNSGIALLKLSS
jgi:hypothetical protein